MSQLLADSRRASGLTQAEVANLVGTSRPNISAYENGRRSPTLETLERFLAANGQQLVAVPKVSFTQMKGRRSKSYFVPNQLPQLSPSAALAKVRLPRRVSWSTPEQVWDLADRQQRLLAYQVILAEGEPQDIVQFIDGTLLAEMWEELFLPKEIRAAWQPVLDSVFDSEPCR
jgi:transcriptional regulator with XRE-family HTH domain